MSKLKIVLLLTLSLMICASCSGDSKKARFKKIFKDAEANITLPIKFTEGVNLTECYVDDDRNALIYVFSVDEAKFENVSKSTYDEDAKRSIIYTISSSPFFDSLCDSGMDYVVKYKSTNGKTKEISIKNDELIDLAKEVISDNQSDFLSAMRHDIGRTLFPIDFGDIICLSGVVNENSVTFEYQYTDSIDPTLITPEFVAYQKETMTHSVRDTAQPYIEEMIEKDYTMNYIMRNSNGVILFKISFSGNDLK